MRHVTLLLCMLPFVAACGDHPAVDFWQSDKKLGNGKRNKLELREDYTGSAKIYATAINDPATWIRFEFDVTWVDNELEFGLDLDCEEGPCDGKANNFDMFCEIIENAEGVHYMDCDADRRWEGYPFQWERDLD